ncbi:bifunctional 23S rRNA (guanine(2069)-N(7))-methyltransferase RlmK/23S rRNA (guanine(2445)-N(2))-methyltransferase RlmL [Algiphilus sp.]|uniref:bifunctional 23S rRNA (guanine(2069)-N(7))-methyltransferase RlmK/23S rRNA (guanine(2445)-N(2))-methyltransferase RlmL n=1 Tax=Algiphilus sp. TaxID=1872431 RepID=UPI0032EF5691
MSDRVEFIATAARGLGPLLAEELRSLGAEDATECREGARFQADLPLLYRCLLGSRIASRVVLPLVRFEEPDGDACYAAAQGVDWNAHFGLEHGFMVEVAGHSRLIAHTGFAGLRVKDAIVDVFREREGQRPSVNTERPDVRVLLHLQGRRALLAIDVGHGPLHRRGYRATGGRAPLRENLAAALLWRAGWPERAARGEALFDPFCGSGTLVIEAALMATNTAPGLLRRTAPPGRWRGHDAQCWRAAHAEADAAVQRWDGPPLQGSDLDPEVVAIAVANARRAGVAAITRFAAADALTVTPPPGPGLLISNLPYGERVASRQELVKLYSLLGDRLKRHFGGWHAALLVGADGDAQRLGLRAERRHAFLNGQLDCELLQFPLHERGSEEEAPPAPAPDFANRLRKNMRHLERWARRGGVENYRLYDADLTEYPLLIDRYRADDGAEHLHVQEFAAPKTVEPARAEARLRGALSALVEVTGVEPAHLHFKQRRAQKGSTQYVKTESEVDTAFWVSEHGCRLRVDLDRYLDSGLFLDHRPIRRQLQEECAGRRFLNLFCYTAAASVHAAVGGARQTVSVDLSNTYLEWARMNLKANGFDAEIGDGRSRRLPSTHALLRGDCLRWLRNAVDDPRLRFERIFCDPPTFSNSKRTEEDFDVQRDHVELIQKAAQLLAPGGVLYFSCNRRRFRLQMDELQGLRVQERTRQTLDEDFRRPPPAHQCWAITREA